MLLNPTKYLGNLLLAGGLIQDFAAHCRQHDRELLVVLDASFRELCAAALVDVQVLWYPRQALRRTGVWNKFKLFMEFLAALRAFRADLAFNIEEDSLASRLTQASGARYRLGCSPLRHGFGYERVLPVDHGKRHRWYGYQEVFTALGLPAGGQPGYINLHINHISTELMQKLSELGLPAGARLVAVHPSATKDYKKWPETGFIELCNILINKGFTPVLIGAGHDEWECCERIRHFVANVALAKAHNLCDQLTLVELAGFFRLCTGMAGNDSGPSHLGSAQGLPGVVVFGPSEPAIWGPLGLHSEVLRKVEHCDPRCSRKACFIGYRCLHAIEPREVFDALSGQIRAGGMP